MRHIHVLKVFELGSGCSSAQILTFLPKLAFHSTFVPINVTAQMSSKYTKVQIQPKQINSRRYPRAAFSSATKWLQAVAGREPTMQVKWQENFEELRSPGEPFTASLPLARHETWPSEVLAPRKTQITGRLWGTPAEATSMPLTFATHR